jgi:transcriptional regulator with XRE-family HTH domain
MLAGISPEYYIRLERGTATSPSPSVVEAVATALRLDHDERLHLDRLLAALTPENRKQRRPVDRMQVSAGIQVLLDSLQHLPAFVSNARLDLIAVNTLGLALYAPYLDAPDASMNTARFLFLHEGRARQFWPQWNDMADDVVAILRAEAGRHPNDPALVELIGHLSTRSEEFRIRWATNNVRAHRAGVKVFRHPWVGEISLPYENLQIDSTGDHVMTVFTPSPNTAAHDAIRLLASWNADPAHTQSGSQDDHD